MHIQLLGAMRISRFGAAVRISAAKQRTVLATLAANANTYTSLELLVDELWEQGPPATAVRTVQTYIYQLRKSLRLPDHRTAAGSEQSALHTSGGGYTLLLGSHSVLDTAQFRNLLKEARLMKDSGRPDRTVAILRGAIDLWTGGPAFGAVPVGPTLSSARTSLHQARTSARELLYETELELGAHHRVLDDLVDLTAGEPTQERFAELLMTALRRCGHRADALRVFHTLRAELDEQFGVPPSGALQRLFFETLEDGSEGSAEAAVR